MDFTVDNQANEKRIALSGSFTFADSQKFKEMMATLSEKPAKAVRLDFAAVEFIDSGALGMLLLFHDACLSKHIPVSLHAARGQVEKIFMISRFDQLFSMRGAK